MNKQIKIGAVLQYLQMGLSILISIIYTPLMLKMLGQSEYGLYNIAASVISYLSLLSLGFGSSYIRFYTIQKKENPDRVKNLNGLYLITFIIIGIVAIIAGLFIASNVTVFLNNTYSNSDVNIATWLMILLSINLGISFPISLFVSYITAQEKFIFLKLINIGKTVLSPALSIVALFWGYGSIGLVVATTIINLAVDAVNIFYCIKRLNMRFSLKSIEFHLLKDIFVFSVFIAINQLIDQINWQTDKVIIGKLITSSAVSVYAIGATINTYFIQFSTAISSLYAPKINAIVVENNEDCNNQLAKLMASVGRIQFFILALVLSGFIFFGDFFILKWAGDGYHDSYYVALLLMIPETVPLIQNIGIEIQRAKNKHKFRSIAYLFMAIINVAISVLLCSKYGVLGVAFGTTISLIVANIIVMNIYYHKAMEINMVYFWKEIIKIFPSLLLPVVAGIIFKIFVPVSGYLMFALQILSYTLVYSISIYLFGLNKNEKNSINRIISRIFNKNIKNI